MLDRAGDAHRDVELGRDDLAGLADLVVVGDEPRVHCGARGADGRAQLVGERVQEMEILAVAHASSPRDDHPRRGQLGPLRPGQLLSDETRRRAFRPLRNGRDRRAGRPVWRAIEGGATDGDHLDGIERLHRSQAVARVDGSHERIRSEDRRDVGDLRHVEQARDARHEILADRRGTGQHMSVVARQAGDEVCQGFGQCMFVGRCIHQQHLGHACDARGPCRSRFAGMPRDKHVHLGADPQRGGHRGARGVLDFAVGVFGNHQNGSHVRSPSLPS